MPALLPASLTQLAWVQLQLGVKVVDAALACQAIRKRTSAIELNLTLISWKGCFQLQPAKCHYRHACLSVSSW